MSADFAEHIHRRLEELRDSAPAPRPRRQIELELIYNQVGRARERLELAEAAVNDAKQSMTDLWDDVLILMQCQAEEKPHA